MTDELSITLRRTLLPTYLLETTIQMTFHAFTIRLITLNFEKSFLLSHDSSNFHILLWELNYFCHIRFVINICPFNVSGIATATFQRKNMFWKKLSIGFNFIKARLWSRYEDTVYFWPQCPRSSWCSFNQPKNDDRLNQPCSHPVVWNPQPLD